MATKMNADAVARQVRNATLDAVDEAMQDAATEARSVHWWNQQHGRKGLEGQVKAERARVEGGFVVAGFGTTQRKGFYGLILERRRPWLRPVADRVFPTVPGRIAKKLAGK